VDKQRANDRIRAFFLRRGCDTQFVGTDGPGGGRFDSAGFQRFCLQPMDGPHVQANTRWAVDCCLRGR